MFFFTCIFRYAFMHALPAFSICLFTVAILAQVLIFSLQRLWWLSSMVMLTSNPQAVLTFLDDSIEEDETRVEGQFQKMFISAALLQTKCKSTANDGGLCPKKVLLCRNRLSLLPMRDVSRLQDDVIRRRLDWHWSASPQSLCSDMLEVLMRSAREARRPHRRLRMTSPSSASIQLRCGFLPPRLINGHFKGNHITNSDDLIFKKAVFAIRFSFSGVCGWVRVGRFVFFHLVFFCFLPQNYRPFLSDATRIRAFRHNHCPSICWPLTLFQLIYWFPG